MLRSLNEPHVLALSSADSSNTALLQSQATAESLQETIRDFEEGSDFLPSDATDLTDAMSEDDFVAPQVQKHERFYFEFAQFLVEDRLFQVPRYQFDEPRSSLWKSLGVVSYDGSAIKLEGVRVADFVPLLNLFYPDTAEGGNSPSLGDWKSILELSHRWEMRKTFEDAMKALHVAPLYEQVILARKNGVYEWLKSTYISLVQRDAFIFKEEAVALGLEAMLNLACIRQKRYQSLLGSGAALGMATQVNFGAAVTKEFGELTRLADMGVCLTMVEQVILGRTHKVVHWVNHAYEALVAREEPISFGEGVVLGLEISRDLCISRETRHRMRFGSGVMMNAEVAGLEVTRLFEEELNGLKEINEYYGTQSAEQPTEQPTEQTDRPGDATGDTKPDRTPNATGGTTAAATTDTRTKKKGGKTAEKKTSAKKKKGGKIGGPLIP